MENKKLVIDTSIYSDLYYIGKLERKKYLPGLLQYIATPFRHKNPEVMKFREWAVTITTAHLFKENVFCYSPITYTIPINNTGIMQNSWDLWSGFDFFMVEQCGGLLILDLPGWNESEGIFAEVKTAQKYNKIIYLLDHKEFLTKYPNYGD